MACGFLVIQGHGGHVGTFPLALSDKYVKTALQLGLSAPKESYLNREAQTMKRYLGKLQQWQFS